MRALHCQLFLLCVVEFVNVPCSIWAVWLPTVTGMKVPSELVAGGRNFSSA